MYQRRRHLMAYFLIWALGFWPVVAFSESLFRATSAGKPVLADTDGLFVLGTVWVVMMFFLYVNAPDKHDRNDTGDYDDEQDEVPNVLMIVEAPSTELARAFGPCLESLVFLDPLPAKGARLVLNDDDSDESGILASVDEIAQTVHKTSDGATHRVWVRLDRPEDYVDLSEKFDWSAGDKANCRTISRPLQSVPETV